MNKVFRLIVGFFKVGDIIGTKIIVSRDQVIREPISIQLVPL